VVRNILSYLLAVLCALFVALAAAQGPVSAVSTMLPPHHLQAAQLAVVVNDDDPGSVAVGAYYQKVRNIPPQNMIHVVLPAAPHRLSAAAFAQLQRHIQIQLLPHIEAIVLLWSSPYAVECQSITSALSLGFEPGLCKNTCAPSKPSPYFNSRVTQPWTEMHLRPSMLLPTDSVELAMAVIDRGLQTGFRLPNAGAYYVQTSDSKRNSRSQYFPPAGTIPDKRLTIHRLNAEVLEGAQDIIVYQIGAAHVAKLETLRFLPGALADHLTSFGGDLLESSQMSSLRWLQAGATASYGNVSEPCNHWQKFPEPSVLLQHYLSGETAIEAYWKSVNWPAQGIFIGDPLAAPYRLGR
jgi:uncharacterized protein (TIGR03790 family)